MSLHLQEIHLLAGWCRGAGSPRRFEYEALRSLACDSKEAKQLDRVCQSLHKQGCNDLKQPNEARMARRSAGAVDST